MKFISTRGACAKGVNSAYAIKTGLASDGGLFMPDNVPQIDESFLLTLATLSYPERAAKVLSLFLTDYTCEELLQDAIEAYAPENSFPPLLP